MEQDGWQPDPFWVHEERLFRHGEPTPLVRDGGIGKLDPVSPATQAPPPPVSSRTRLILRSSGVLIALGVVVGLLGLKTGGGTPRAVPPAATTTTINPFVRWIQLLPTTTQPDPAQQATTLSFLELALKGLSHSRAATAPRSTTTSTTSTTTSTTSTTTSTTSTTTSTTSTAPPTASTTTSTTLPLIVIPPAPPTTTPTPPTTTTPAPTTTSASTTSTPTPATTAPPTTTTTNPAPTTTSSSTTSSTTTSLP